MELVNRGDLETMGRIKVKLGSCPMAMHVPPLISITSSLSLCWEGKLGTQTSVTSWLPQLSLPMFPQAPTCQAAQKGG